ncbi:cytochrome P450 [Streptomyces sp. LE64]|uniref:cytochrome P450 n=1 Tax=Streptomyces sp. LE64 TaxID=3448653 RepID=UPI0040422190
MEPDPHTHAPVLDSTASLLVKGYGWLPDLRRRAQGAEAVPVRLLIHRGVARHGPEAVRFFYDERHVRSQGALPGPVLDTLFGRGAVHTLDGAAHRGRKALFTTLLIDPERIAALNGRAAVAWFLTFAAHALHRWPHHRDPLLTGEGSAPWAFVQEVRRFYPFAAGLAATDTEWGSVPIPEGGLVLLDLYGHNHDPALWPDPYVFDPARFTGPAAAIAVETMIPQGGGEAATGHRCPGEDVTAALLASLAPRLAALHHAVPDQDLTIPLHRIPTRPRSGYAMTGIHPPGWEAGAA